MVDPLTMFVHYNRILVHIISFIQGYIPGYLLNRWCFDGFQKATLLYGLLLFVYCIETYYSSVLLSYCTSGSQYVWVTCVPASIYQFIELIYSLSFYVICTSCSTVLTDLTIWDIPLLWCTDLWFLDRNLQKQYCTGRSPRIWPGQPSCIAFSSLFIPCFIIWR